MTSDSSAADADPTADDLDRLLGASVEAALRLLSSDGEFYPFALAMTGDGDVVSPAVEPDSDHPSSEQVARLLLAALREARGSIRAASLCSDVKVVSDEGEERDAIRIELEAPGSDPVTVVVPYAGTVLDQPFGMPGERRVFA
jgi:hypothetical protein